GEEDRVDQPLTVAELAREHALDDKALMKKYRNKVLTITGKINSKLPPNDLFLESGNTDQLLTVQCRLHRHHFDDLDAGPDFRIRGLCTGMTNTKTLRLDSCEPIDTVRNKDPRTITAEYLPHKPGRTQTYDVATYPALDNTAP